jgi:hypothetical protein
VSGIGRWRGSVCLLAAVLLAACDGGPTGVSLTADDVRGRWVLTFDDLREECAAGPTAPYDIRLDMTDVLTDIVSGTLWVVGEWRDAPDAGGWRAAQGQLRPQDGSFELVLWDSRVQENAPRLVLHGELDGRPGITGTWEELDGGVLPDGACAGTVRGERQAS